MPDLLPPGLYESLLTLGLRDAVEEITRQGWTASLESIDDVLTTDILADHVRDATRRSLNTIGGDGADRLSARLDVINRILETLRQAAASGAVSDGDSVAAGSSVLREVRRLDGFIEEPPRPRPHISLRESALLVNGHRDYQVGQQVARELASADQVDLLCAFVRFAGINVIRGELEAFVRRGGQLRVIASVYTGSTEKRALDDLVRLGASVKVSFETDQTRLHAKAWRFYRAAGTTRHTLVRPTCPDQPWWMVWSGTCGCPDWSSRICSTRLRRCSSSTGTTQHSSGTTPCAMLTACGRPSPGNAAPPPPTLGIEVTSLDVRPYPYQQEVLEELAAAREIHDNWRNLVVMATGTGKTVIAALD